MARECGVGIWTPKHREVVVVDSVPAPAQQIIAERFVSVLPKICLQVFGEGSPDGGGIDCCHQPDPRGRAAYCFLSQSGVGAENLAPRLRSSACLASIPA